MRIKRKLRIMFKASSEQNLQNFFIAKRFINVNNQACF